MDVPVSCLVTLRCVNPSIDIDVELPSELPIRELKSKLISVLNDLYGVKLAGDGYRLRHRYRVLNDEESLNNAGIYDGSILLLTSVA